MNTVSPGQTILIVEDSDEDFEIAERALRESQMKNPLRRCEDGQETLDYLYHSGPYSDAPAPRPGIILLDLNLPGVDGRRVLSRIKSDEALKDIPVVVLTTSSDKRDIESCYGMGANTYIAKPVDLDDFVESLKRVKAYWFETAILPVRDPAVAGGDK